MNDPLTDRVTSLEELLTHLQRTIQDLDQVVLQQQRQLDRFESQFLQLAENVSSLSATVTEPQPPDIEKPPHY